MSEKSTGGQLGHLSACRKPCGFVQLGFENLQGNCTAFQYLFIGWVTYIVKFLIQQEFSLLQLMSITSCPSAVCLWEKSIFLVVPASVFDKLQVDSFFYLLQTGETQFLQGFLYVMCSRPLTARESLFWACASLLVRVCLLHTVSGAASGALSRGNNPFPLSAGLILPVQPGL